MKIALPEDIQEMVWINLRGQIVYDCSRLMKALPDDKFKLLLSVIEDNVNDEDNNINWSGVKKDWEEMQA